MKTITAKTITAKTITAKTITAKTAPTSVDAIAPSQPQPYSIFMLLKTTSTWLSLSIDQRFAFIDTDIRPILKAHPAVKMRFFDTEGFNSRVTDVMIWETEDLFAYQSVVEALRESVFWDTYFEIVEILPGIENGYASHYGVEPM